MLNASPAAQDLVASYNGGKVSAQGMATAQNATKASTIGLTIAQTALNAAIGMGIGLVISLVTQGISKLIHANEEAIESAEELREKYEDFKSTNASNISTLKGLEDEFDELSKGVSQYGDNISLTTEQYERYTEIIQQIVGMSPSLAEGYSTENGYIADKNGLLERAIELQEIEYKNELRKMTNLENLKTSMSGYIAEYNDALHGGYITAEGNIIGTTIDTDFKNSLWQLFNTNNRDNYDAQSMAKDIMESLGVEDIDAEMQKYFNDYGYWQDSWFWDDYCDTIINNLNAVTDSLSFEEVGLDEEVFNQNLEKLGSYAESYRDMKDSVEMANDAIQTDLGYIAEYADGYSNLSTEQEKFVSDFLKGFDISDVATEDGFGKLKYDNDKMASVKSQIKDFVKDLSQDESTKKALSDLYAIPTDEQSISEYVEQFRTALDIIKAYCEENGIEIPIAITNKEEEINELEAQQQRAVDFAKGKFDGYDPTAFFKKHSINTKEEVDKWLEIAQAANSAAEAEKRYVQGSTLDNETTNLLGISETIDQLNTKLKPTMDSLASAYHSIFTSDGFTLKDVGVDMLSSIKKEIDELNSNEKLGISIDYSSFEEFSEVLSDTSSSSSEVQEQFNKLATEIVRATGSTEVTSENFTVLSKALTEMGLTNAVDILNQITDAQNEYKEVSEQLGYTLQDVANATYEETTQMLIQAQAAGLDSSSLFKLAVAQGKITDGTINSESNVEALLAEAQAAGLDLSVLTALENVRNGNIKDTKSAQTILDNAKKQIISSMSEFKLDFDFSPAAKSAGKAGKDAGEEYKEALKEELSDLDDVLGYITNIIGDQIDLLNDQKDAAIDALEAEKEAAEEALEAQKELVQEKIDGLQDEIDAIKEAREQRQAELDLQKKQYDFERMQNQKTNLIYKGGQMVYETDTEGIRDARESLEESKENLKILQIEKEISGLEDIIESLDKQIEESNKYYDSLIEQCEKYWDAQIKAMEDYKSRWEQIGELEEQAKIQVALKELGIETEDILNMSGDAFEQFKQRYLGVLTEMYSDNDAMVASLKEVAGSADFTLLDNTLSATKDKIDELSNSATTATTPIKDTASAVGEIATNSEGVGEDINEINTALDTLSDGTKLDGVKSAFESLLEVIKTIATELGTTTEDMQATGGLIGAIEQLNQAQIGTGLLEQFTALKAAIDSVTSAISGGAQGQNLPQGGAPTIQGAMTPSGSPDSAGTGGLTQALKDQVEEAKNLLPEEISLFSGDEESLLSAVNKVTTAIAGGSGDAESGEKGNKTGEGETDASHLMGAIDAQYQVAELKIPEETDYFTELATAIELCVSHLTKMTELLEGLTVGDIQFGLVNIHGKGTVGKAFANGTGKYKGLAHAEKNAVRSEYGQPELTVYPNGVAELTTEPVMSDLPKGTEIFNEEQTRRIMNNKGKVVGKAFASGTIQNPDGSIIFPDGTVGTPLPDDHPINVFFRNWEKKHMDFNESMVTPMHSIQDNISEMVRGINNISTNNTKNQQVVIGDINVNCPGVTSQEVAKQISSALHREIGGIALDALQESSITR